MRKIDRYAIVGELGRGGMGVVYDVRDAEGQPWALKVLTEGEPETVRRFAREARILGFLGCHEGIVGLREVGDEQGRPYFVMDRIAGGTLARHPGPVEAAARILIKVARAVHFAHEAGIVHRDLKPSNVLIDQAGEPRVTDFGVAKVLTVERMTQTGLALGTISFMAPEQIEPSEGQTVDRRTDVYALGVMLYVMLAGRVPFKGLDITVAKHILLDAPASPGGPAAVERVCLRAMSKAPRDRPQTAEAFATELEEALSGATRAPAPAPARTGVALRLAVALGIVGFVVGAVGIAFGIDGTVRAGREATRADLAKERLAALERLTVPGTDRAALLLGAARRWRETGEPGALWRAAEAVERAVEADFEAVMRDTDLAILLEEAAREMLRSIPLEPSPEAGALVRIRRAREWLLIARLIAPDQKLPAAQHLLRLAESPSAPIRFAAMPWLADWPLEIEDVRERLAGRLPEQDEARMTWTVKWPHWPRHWSFPIRAAVPGGAVHRLGASWVLFRPEISAMWQWLAEHLRAANRVEEAVRAMAVATSKERSAETWFYAARAQRCAGRLSEALKTARMAVTLKDEAPRHVYPPRRDHEHLLAALQVAGGDEAAMQEVEAGMDRLGFADELVPVRLLLQRRIAKRRGNVEKAEELRKEIFKR